MTFKMKRRLLIGGILLTAVAVNFGLRSMKPPPETEEAGPLELLVDVQTLQADDYQFAIESQGTVRPLTETILSAEVSGSIVRVSPKFIAGGVFAAGEELMRIDQTNYVGSVQRAEALVKQRQIEFDGAKSLRTKGYRAEAELAAADAALADANATLIRARRDLDRTRIRLPYDGMVRRRSADIGRYVNSGQELGVVFATQSAEVRLPLIDLDLAFVHLPDAREITSSGDSADGPMVTLSAVQRGRPVEWQARIVRSEGVVDERARVTYAVARIKDPYNLQNATSHASTLPMGTFVQARIEGAGQVNAVRLPRSALRRNNEIVIIDSENRIRLRDVNVIRADAVHAYASPENLVGERISVTAIESPLNGQKVRTTDDPPPDDEDDADDESRVAADTSGEPES